MAEVHAAERLIHATPTRLWRALTTGEELAAWRAPEGMRGEVERFDARVGGIYRMALVYIDGGDGKSATDRDIFEGRFLALETESRVEEAIDFVSDDPAFRGTMRMITTLTSDGNGTQVRIEAHDVPSGIRREDHEAGIASSLLNLARHVE